MERFRSGNAATSHVPLSEAARKIRDEKDDPQSNEIRDSNRTSEAEVSQEDEKFEWREVIRGTVVDKYIEHDD